MKRHECSIAFQWDEGDDTKVIDIFTPDNVTKDTVESELVLGHEYLCNNDEDDLYGKEGRTPETLVECICQKNGWHWEEHTPDITLSLP